MEPELIQQAEVPDPVASDAKEGAEARTAKESPFLLKPRTPGNVPAGARPVSRPAVPDAGKPENSDASESPVVQPAAGVAARSGEKNEAFQESKEEVRDEDYFIRKMRERVMAYHNRASSAEVSDKSGIYRQEEQADRIREAAVYNAQPAEEAVQPKPQQLDLFEENFLKRDVRAEYKLIGQVFDTYWLVQYQDSLYIIDQHAAHERVLYERTLKGMKTREFTSQYLSPPIILSLSMQEAELLKENMDRFARIGFEIEPFGGEEYAVRAVPDNLFGIAKKELLMEMIDDLADGISSSMTPELIDEKVASMSCKAAVKGNNRLSAQEVNALIGELLTLDNPYHCPHGRPTIIAMTKRELEKKFKRIV